MNTTLCFDFGNTRLKCGVFKGNELTELFSLANDNVSTIEELLKKYTPEKTILSSVVNHNGELEKILEENSSFHKLSSQSILPFTTPVGKPETIGADRLALAAAAVCFYKGKNNLVIGLGSCVTYNFISKYNSFLGGSISPGMEMRFKSLNTFTAKLPFIKPDWNFPLIGYDTRTNILSGVLMGLAVEIDGVIDKYRDKFDNFNVLLTGGTPSILPILLKTRYLPTPT